MKTLPILMAFFLMGLADATGPMSDGVKKQYELSNLVATLLPYFVFIAFAMCSIPGGLMAARMEKKGSFFSVSDSMPWPFSLTVEKRPECSNELSGLMCMAISGGALLPPVDGLADGFRLADPLIPCACSLVCVFVAAFFPAGSLSLRFTADD